MPFKDFTRVQNIHVIGVVVFISAFLFDLILRYLLRGTLDYLHALQLAIPITAFGILLMFVNNFILHHEKEHNLPLGKRHAKKSHRR